MAFLPCVKASAAPSVSRPTHLCCAALLLLQTLLLHPAASASTNGPPPHAGVAWLGGAGLAMPQPVALSVDVWPAAEFLELTDMDYVMVGRGGAGSLRSVVLA